MLKLQQKEKMAMNDLIHNRNDLEPSYVVTVVKNYGILFGGIVEGLKKKMTSTWLCGDHSGNRWWN